MKKIKRKDWLPTKKQLNNFNINDCIIKIENNIIYCKQFKFSSLRGKCTKQSEKEINNQILNFRTEWNRNL